ncbi:MAG TPA: thioredoxin domain-containing protein [Thermoanaerobaculia bacterium]|jgi:protein-disulfide isomerase|nr:thioredoxin domain-containing protein [Thermoanaerobaculia bacterium]
MNVLRRKPLIPGVLFLILALGVYLPACSAQDKNAKKMDKMDSKSAGSGEVLAVVNGKAITEAEVRQNSAEQFKAMEREYQQNLHQLLENGLEQVVQERLVEAEAAARGVTKDALLAEIKAGAVTDADVDAFYEQNKAQIPRPKEQVAAQIKAYLEQQNQQKARQDFYSKLQDKYKVEYKMEPIRVEVAATGPSRGPANAPVTIVEFSDFQCPFCSRLTPTIKQVEEKYGDKVRVVFRQYPLPFHQNAQKAAEASLCAADQGKFWEMHDAMFANQQALEVDKLKAKAAELGLNAEQFNQCLDSGKHAATIQADMKDGSAVGVNGTPALFINGRFLSGAQPLEAITPIIDDELRRAGQKTASK